MPVKYRLTVFISWGNFKDELYKSYIENLKDSQICNIDLKLSLGKTMIQNYGLTTSKLIAFPLESSLILHNML